jgi:DNA-binding HxlR family transcriptional regulator
MDISDEEGKVKTMNGKTNKNGKFDMRPIRGPRHAPYVVMTLGQGAKTFNEIERDTRIPPSTLSRSLKLLLKAEMIKTRPLTEAEEAGPCRGMWKYELTPDGENLRVLAVELDKALQAFWDKIQ